MYQINAISHNLASLCLRSSLFSSMPFRLSCSILLMHKFYCKAFFLLCFSSRPLLYDPSQYQCPKSGHFGERALKGPRFYRHRSIPPFNSLAEVSTSSAKRLTKDQTHREVKQDGKTQSPLQSRRSAVHRACYLLRTLNVQSFHQKACTLSAFRTRCMMELK